MAHVAFFLCTAGCFSIFPITRNDTGVYFRLGRSFQDLTVLTAAHRTAPAIRGHIGLSCGVCLSRGKEGRTDDPSKAEVMLSRLGPARCLPWDPSECSLPLVPWARPKPAFSPPCPSPRQEKEGPCPGSVRGRVRGRGRGEGGRGLQRALWTHEGSKTPREKRHLRRGGRGLVTKGTLTRCSSQTGAGGGGGFSRAAALRGL